MKNQNLLLIKVGGGQNVNWDGICRDLKELHREGIGLVLVHGASEQRNELAARLFVPVRTVISPSNVSSVYTDEQAMDVFLMAYAGLVNKRVVRYLLSCDLNAVGLSGVDGRLWVAKSKKEILVKEGNKVKVLKGNLTGRVEEVNVHLVELLLDHNYIPVICAPAISFEGEIVNTDNDWAIAVMAEALKVKRIIYLFEAPGLLKDPKDERTLISRVPRDKITEYLCYTQNRMKKKVLGAQRALQGGVNEIFWGDSRSAHPVFDALEGKGTVIAHFES